MFKSAYKVFEMIEVESIIALARPREKLKKTKNRKISTQFEIEKDLVNKFVSSMTNKSHDILKVGLLSYYAKNFAMVYKEDYKFSQEWQGIQEKTEKYDFFYQQNYLFSSLLLALTIINVVNIWLNTIQAFFLDDLQTSITPSILIIIAIILETVYCFCKILVKKIWEEQNEIILAKLIKSMYKNFVIFVYFVMKLVGVERDMNLAVWYGTQAICIFLIYKRSAKIYSYFKLSNLALAYEYQCKIIDIILNLVIIAHTIAIILYLSTKCGFKETWVSAAGLEQEPPLVKYIYSFYFCCTTILTVGYGDITPRNYVEVIFVTLIQIFGVIAFGSLINEVGNSLTTMRKKREDIEKGLNTIEKIRKWHKLDDKLVKRARSHIINSKVVNSPLSPEEENTVMVKLSQQLRHEIFTQNALKMVKSSIFFLLRWSKSFQNAISLRLCSIILPPGQLLYQPLSKQRIYIIREGKIDIYASKRGARRGNNQTILKTIKNDLSNEVSNNVYGYTAVISRRPVQLYAITKQNSAGYFIEKQKFLQCIHERQSDYEYFHEFKDKIDLLPCWQSIQIPHLDSTKHHFNPSRLFIIRKYSKQVSFQTGQHRYVRKSKRTKCCFYNSLETERMMRNRLHTYLLPNFKLLMPMKTFMAISQNKDQKAQQCRMPDNTYFHHYFQSSKEYTNYFPKNNREKVFKSYDLEMKVSNAKQTQYVHSDFYDSLREYRLNCELKSDSVETDK